MTAIVNTCFPHREITHVFGLITATLGRYVDVSKLSPEDAKNDTDDWSVAHEKI